MNSYYKEKAVGIQRRQYICCLLRTGMKKIKAWKPIAVFYDIMLVVTIIMNLDSIIVLLFFSASHDVLGYMWQLIISIVMLFVIVIVMPILEADPFEKDKYCRELFAAGMVNAAGEPPLILDNEVCLDEKYGKCIKLTFLSPGIPFSMWNDRKESIEAAIKRRILYIDPGERLDMVELITAPPDAVLPVEIYWDNKFMQKTDSDYVLGMALPNRLLTYNVDETPNLMIAASTGGGKTNLIRGQIKQAMYHGVKVILIDKKRGIDFGPEIVNNVVLLKENEEIDIYLQKVVDEMNRRFDLIANDKESTNIVEYRQNGGDMQRILIVIDEFAQITQSIGKGSTTEEKKMVQHIITNLCTICQLSRAVGITIIASTQRPDADVIPGQIRSNINVKVCGRADENLSRVVFGNGRADKEIPKNLRGRFMLEDGTQFQAFIVPKQ